MASFLLAFMGTFESLDNIFEEFDGWEDPVYKTSLHQMAQVKTRVVCMV